MSSKKVHILENQLRLLSESEWNYHVGSNHDLRPYVSDNKFQMFGRETGHFGSGTYFSTYRGNKDIESYGSLGVNADSNFIKVGEHVYRVDFDLYKNLYRVRSKRQGDILYTMMRNLNALYNRIVFLGKFSVNAANYDNSSYYQVIRKNADALGLKCPSYYALTRMAQRHEGVQSFSTLFMEWNGYNGVNVSGIDEYDNTKHGSVIYDLSKVNTEMEEVSPRSLYVGYKDSSYDDTVARDGLDDAIVDSLKGEYINWYYKLNEMPLPKALRILKNYTSSGNVLSPFIVKELKPELVKRYLRFVFIKNPNGRWVDPVMDEIISGDNSRYYTELIDEYGAYYWVNYIPRENGYNSVLVNLLSNFSRNIPWDSDTEQEKSMKEEYLRKLMSYMERDLSDYEREYIEEDYY